MQNYKKMCNIKTITTDYLLLNYGNKKSLPFLAGERFVWLMI